MVDINQTSSNSLLTLEAAKLLMLLRRKGEPLSLGQLDNRGGWMPDPLVKFGNHKVGEILAMYTADDSVLHAACRREVTNNKADVKHETLDKTVFVIDQTFLLCLFVTLTLVALAWRVTFVRVSCRMRKTQRSGSMIVLLMTATRVQPT